MMAFQQFQQFPPFPFQPHPGDYTNAGQYIYPLQYYGVQGPSFDGRYSSSMEDMMYQTPGAVDSMDTKTHSDWKGRLAPLPGVSSSPDMLHPSYKSRRVEIRAADMPSSASPSFSNELSSFSLDKYANVFIPRYLQEIQKQPQNFQPLPPLPIYPSPLYHLSFLPLSIIQKFNDPFPSNLLAFPSPDKIAASLSPPPPLNPITYHQHWKTLLSWELDELATNKEKIILWQVRITVFKWDMAEFYVLVPGIRENYPRLDVGDVIFLREVLVQWKSGSGKAFEGRVATLRKREGFIHFYCPTLKKYIEIVFPNGVAPGEAVPPVFNLSFLTSAYPSVKMDRAAATLGGIMTVDRARDVAQRWLFPELDDLRRAPPIVAVPPHVHEEYWVDEGLNEEQHLAAVSISTYQSPVPFLISGPPGTGKTRHASFRTIVETVHQILRVHAEAHILLCAPSNTATDTLALRLALSLKPVDMLRLNDPNRTFAEVPDTLRQFCYIENDKFALPSWEKLMNFRVVVASCLDSNILVDGLCTNTVLCALEEQIMALHPHRRVKHQAVPHWTHLLIDEAAQGREPELLIPISVVLTPARHLDDNAENKSDGISNLQVNYKYHPLAITPQLVLCGDPHQLGPIITSQYARTHELDISLLERLCDRPLYADHAETRNSPRVFPLTESPLYIAFQPFVNLVKNYRSHPAILMPPSAMFYNDSLKACATNGLISWTGLSNSKIPLMFLGCETPDESHDERATWFNTGEIDRVVEVITSLLSEASKSFPPLQVDEIGVMAPWREQVWKIREKLRERNLSRIDVGTVVDFQGREKRVVVISCVRSSTRWLKEDEMKGIGVVFEKKRMNVAITRAKELMVIIGNANMLKCDPYWKGFLQFALRNNIYYGPKLEIEEDGAWISKLESRMAEAAEEIGHTAVDDTGMRNTMMLAGGVAREVLKELSN